MWMQLARPVPRVMHTAVCYFPPETSVFACSMTERGEFTYAPLFAYIAVSQQGEVLLLGDFNAQIAREITSTDVRLPGGCCYAVKD